MNQTPPPSEYIYSIPEMAVFLELAERVVRRKAEEYNWQPTGERIQGGGGKYNIDTIRFYKSDEKDAATRQKIKGKISDNETVAREAIESAAITAQIVKIREQQRLDEIDSAEIPMSHEDREELWRFMAKKNNVQQQKAERKALAVGRLQSLRDSGMGEGDAVNQVAEEYGAHPQSVRNWNKKTQSVHRSDLAAVLITHCYSSVSEAEFTPEAWETFKKDFLRRRHPSISSCYRRLQAAAAVNGWTIPTKKTVENWIKRKINPMVVKCRREGMEAVEKCFPAMKRDKEMFDVLQAVNGDGFALGIWADFGNGTIAKPIIWSWQDIRSSKVLVWRMDISENRELVRLATLDLISEWGVPELLYLDNTRAATSKQISGGLPNRYRFKVKDDDPLGIMPLLGITLKYTLPGHGQSKPVERIHGIGGYLDFDSLPVFEGRGTKSRPVPIAEVEALFKDFVNEINARPDRRGDAVQGKSFNQVFNELYPDAIITKSSEKQRKYCLCVAEVVTVSLTDASITLKAGKSDIGSNRYWNDALTGYMGQKVTVRFDPANMHSGVYVETIKGEEICFAEPTSKGGFKDADAAREHARNKGHFKKHIRLAAEAEGRMSADTARQYMIAPPEPEKPAAAKVTRIAATVPSKAKQAPAAVSVGWEDVGEVITGRSALDLFVEAKKAAAPKEMTQEEIDTAFFKGVETLTGFKRAI
jgi:uncharacterized protein YoaH (UPF0181 family)